MMDYLDFLADKLYRSFVTESDGELLSLLSLKSPGQSDLDAFLKKWDIEREPRPERVLMLAYFKKMNPGLEFPVYYGPRLDGVMAKYSFENIKKQAQFAKAAKALNKESIPVLLIKGGAMRVLRPGFARVMGDIDFAVPADMYGRAIEAVGGAGFTAKNVEPNSTDLMGPDGDWAIDLHRRILVDDARTDKLTADIFARAEPTAAFGIDLLVPRPEDMVFIALCNLTKNLVKKNSLSGILFPMFDCAYLASFRPGFDWGLVERNMREGSLGPETLLAARFVGRLSPGLLPELGADGEFDGYYRDKLFREFYLERVKAKKRALPFRAVFGPSFYETQKKFFNYFIIKLKYLLIRAAMRAPGVVGFGVRRRIGAYERSIT